MSIPLLEVRDLHKHFSQIPQQSAFFGSATRDRLTVKAVDGVSFTIAAGETLGLVGESGCGKSTLGRLIVNLLQPTSGEVLYQGRNIHRLSRQEMLETRRYLRMIFQNLDAALNPQMRVKKIIEEPLVLHTDLTREARQQRVLDLLDRVRLPAHHLNTYSHTLSGGEKRRVSLARALIVDPQLIVADEPLSAMDVSTQAQLLELLLEIKMTGRTSILFISHDLVATRTISDRIAVMYLGKIVEIGPKACFSKDTVRHPYSKALFSSIMTVSSQRLLDFNDIGQHLDYRRTAHSQHNYLKMSSTQEPSGCRYYRTCQKREQLDSPDECLQVEPALRSVGDQHYAACHFVDVS